MVGETEEKSKASVREEKGGKRGQKSRPGVPETRSGKVSLCDSLAAGRLLQGLTLFSPSASSSCFAISAPCEENAQERMEERLAWKVPEAMQCSACNISFPTREDQVQHYRLDWHRFNLKLSLFGKPAISEDAFEAKLDGELSSISGSEESEEEEENRESSLPLQKNKEGRDSMLPGGQGKVCFQNKDGHILCLHRCLLHPKKAPVESERDLINLAQTATDRMTWAILLLSGGHFAGAIFRGSECVAHKTFHAYTTRAKQGGTQSTKDSKASTHFRSAGASLRRYNEASLIAHIQVLLRSWKEVLEGCDLVFYRAGVQGNKVFFGGKDPVLKKEDPRLRTLPVVIRRPTFAEVKRVHCLLSTLDCLGLASEVTKVCQEKGKKSSRARQVEARSSPNRPLPEGILVLAREQGPCDIEESLKGDSLIAMETGTALSQLQLDFTHLSHDCGTGKSPGEEADSGNGKNTEQLHTAKGKDNMDELYTSVKTNNGYAFSTCLDSMDDAMLAVNGEVGDPERPCHLLHVASDAGSLETLKLLLEVGADPTLPDFWGRVPYDVAKDKDTRNVFRRFMAAHPLRYDYVKAKVPSGLTSEMEDKQREKRKAQRTAKKEMQKEKKKGKEKEKREGKERDVFLQLPSSDKREVERCFLCGKGLKGGERFQAFELSFCSVGCVRIHRFDRPLPS